MPRILLLLLTLLLAGCAIPKVDPAREAQADRVYEMVRRNDVAGLMAMATPALAQQDVSGALRQLQAHVHPSAPTSVRTLGWTLHTINSDATYEVARLYTHPEGQVQARVLMAREGDGPWRIHGVNVRRVTPAMLTAYEEAVEAAQFRLSYKSPLQYLVLIGAGLSLTLCLVSAVAAGIRRRWGWMIGCLFGVCQLSMNWTTGAVVFQPLYIALLGAGFLKGLGPLDPWIVSVAIPLPALLFWGLGKGRPKPPKQKTTTDKPIEADAGSSGS